MRCVGMRRQKIVRGESLRRRRVGISTLSRLTFLQQGAALVLVAFVVTTFSQELRKHMNSVERKGGTKTKGTRPSKCAACGKDTYFMCMLCDKPVCFRGSKGCETWDCIMDLHDEECFGLLRCDATVAKNWKKPSARQRLRHADYVQNIMN